MRFSFVAFLLVASCASATAHVAPSVASPAAPVAIEPAASPPASPPPIRADEAREPSLPSAFDVAAIDAYLADVVRARALVGMSVAIVRDGEIVLAKGYGRRSLAPELPVEPSTLFEVGSITKQFTSAGVLLLAEQKRLALADPVAKFYPDLTRARDITLHDLATHVSGYPDTYPLDYVDREMQEPTTPDEVIARYGKRPLDFEPRTRWSYSSSGYYMLGRVVERTAGEPLAKFFEERFFRPLGMDHTTAATAKEPRFTFATGYTSFALGPPEPAKPEATGWHFGAGGIRSTAIDLAKWDLALMNGKVLSPASFATMTAPRTLQNGRSTGYGCGIGVTMSRRQIVFTHDGGEAGFFADNAIVPSAKAAVVLLVNRDDVDASDLKWKILGLVLDASPGASAPTVTGEPLERVASEIFAELQAGKVDRARLGDDFNVFLADDKIREAAPRLRALGAPTRIEAKNVHERGGMEASTVVITLAHSKLQASVFRRPDGKIEQFLLRPQ